jgi:hypothetical protein
VLGPEGRPPLPHRLGLPGGDIASINLPVKLIRQIDSHSWWFQFYNGGRWWGT